MKKTIVILTRLYIKEGTDEDEFKPIKCPDSENYKYIRSLDVDILILHGHNKRFISTNPFRELSAEVTQLLETRKAYLFYHLGNETIIAELPKVSTANDENPFLGSMSYTIGGGGEPRTRGKVVADLYKAINANDSLKANECAIEMLKNFQHDSNTQTVFDMVNALINLPLLKNREEVVQLLSSHDKLSTLKIELLPLSEYIKTNYLNHEKMKTVAFFVKQKLQTT